MRTVRNLTWFLLAFSLTIWAGVVSAQTVRGDPYFGFYTDGPWYSTADAMCSNVASRTGAKFTRSVNTIGQPMVVCYGIKAGATVESALRSGNGHSHCFSPTQYADYAAKKCVGEKPPDTNPPPSCKAGESGDYTYKSGPRGGANNYSPYKGQPNDGTCDVRCKEVKECFSKPNSNSPDTVYCIHVCEKTGNPKSSGDGSDSPQDGKEPDDKRDDAPPFDSPKGPCPAGSVQAGVNSDGVPRCVGTGSEPKNPQPKPPTTEKQDTQQNPDGSSTTTTTTTTSNSDGSTTTVVSKTTTGSDGKKTTTESRDTTKSPTGGSGRDESKKDEEKYDLCKQNPHLTICKNSSVAGTCGQVSCDGDAIQCATLRAAAAMQCKQQENEDLLKASPLTARGNAAINGTDLDGLPNSKNAEVVNIPTLNAQGWLGNGAAFRDVSITVQGKQIVVPLSKWSDYLLPFRYIMMIIASLISYRILAGAITRT